MSGKLTLILGGARSGKSRQAEQIAREQARPVCYIATCRTAGLDAEMRTRVARHQADRPANWLTVEDRFDLATLIAEHSNDLLLLDCLTLWLGHQQETLKDETSILSELERAWQAIRNHNASVIVVSNELGLGVVPEYPDVRAFRDLCGHANQLTARAADEVMFMMAGLPWELKPRLP